MLRPFDGKTPRLGARVFVAETAAVIGDVDLGDDASIWYGATLRGDMHFIRIGRGSNVQDNCTIHVTTNEWPAIVGDEVTIGHGAIVHGCTVGRGALIGMGSRVLDGAVVGAGALVAEGMHVPPRTLVVGVPARVKRDLTAEEIERLDLSWRHYVEIKNKYLQG